MVLVVSFVALAVLWPEPRLEKAELAAAAAAVGRVLASRPVEIVCGAIGVFLLGLVDLRRARAASQSADRQLRADVRLRDLLARRWCRLSVLFGDVFRAFNPWRAIGRAVAWVARTAAAAGHAGAAGLPGAARPLAGGGRASSRSRRLELVVSNGDQPDSAGHRGARLLGDHVRRRWRSTASRRWMRPRRGLLRLLQPVRADLAVGDARRRARPAHAAVGPRRSSRPLPGPWPLLAVMIGSVIVRRRSRRRRRGTTSRRTSSQFFQRLGLLAAAARSRRRSCRADRRRAVRRRLLPARRRSGRRASAAASAHGALADAFAHSLVPIALAYVAAHYFTLLLFQGQAIWLYPRLSRPAREGHRHLRHGRHADRLRRHRRERAPGTGRWRFVVVGHVAALIARARPGAGALRRREAGRALAVLDARGDGRLHEPRAVAAVAVERMMFQIAHAGPLAQRSPTSSPCWRSWSGWRSRRSGSAATAPRGGQTTRSARPRHLHLDATPLRRSGCSPRPSSRRPPATSGTESG